MSVIVSCLFTGYVSCAVNDPDFKAGVASLAQLLQIPPHVDHLVVLKVSVSYLYGIFELHLI